MGEKLERKSLILTSKVQIAKYGLDISMYFQYVWYTAMYIFLMYLMILPIPVFYAYQDINKTFINTLTLSLQSSPIRGCFYYLSLLGLTLSISFFTNIRKAQTHNPLRKDILIMHIPKNTPEQQITKQIEHITGQYSVKSILKITNPKSYGLQKDLYLREKEFYDRLQQDGIEKMKIETGKVWRKMKLISLVQFFGFHRDHNYYKHQIKSIEMKIRSKQLDSIEDDDAAIVTFTDALQAKKFIKKSKRLFGVRISSKKVDVKIAPYPDDIIYENLGVSHILRFGKQTLTFFIVVVISLINFLILSWMRQWERDLQLQQSSYIMSKVVYVAIFIVMLLFDLVFRPILYWANYYEQHISNGAKEKSWMLRLFIYSILNKFSMIFSRNFIALINVKGGENYLRGLASVFQYTTYWRRGDDTGGNDLQSYLLICIVMYPILEFLMPILYRICQLWAASTEYDKIQARAGTDIRYTSVWTSIIVCFCVVLCFSFVLPELLLLYSVFVVVYGFLSVQIIQNYLCKLPCKISGVSKMAEILSVFSVQIAVFFLAISYDQWLVWLVCGEIFVVLVYISGYFAFKAVRKEPTMTESQLIEEDTKEYELPKPFYTEFEKKQVEVKATKNYTAAVI